MLYARTATVVFFQAEDGIRDLVRSRGLGDVYKRQVSDLRRMGEWSPQCRKMFIRGNPVGVGTRTININRRGALAVSYTHLTLPTSDLV